MKTTARKTLPTYRQLLGVANAKTVKGEDLGYLTGILYLAPYKISGRNVCPHASQGCAAACLYTAGMGAFSNVQAARIAKTKEFHSDPKGFVEMLARNIERLVKRAEKLGLKPCVRLNGTSDLPWENLGGVTGKNLMERFPAVAFYDYTKNPNRIKPSYSVNLPRNYSLTFSASESNGEDVARAISWGVPVAMVFSGIPKAAKIPALRWGLRIVDGDKHDLRFLDKGAGIVALRAKGEAKKDDTGFVRPFNTRFLSISSPKTPCAI